MQTSQKACAGLDVHKQSVVACRISADSQGVWRNETRKFGTMTDDLLLLGDWLRAGGVAQVAMESTGVYWKPIFNILESEFEVLLVNAQHIKFVPGRKTDVNDAQWIADLLQHGLLRASFIPAMEQRDMRALTRYRTQLTQERTQEINRVQKVLEDANIKLSSVASDVLGVSGRDMLAQLIAGQDDPVALAQLARKQLRSKIAELERALKGRMRDVHRTLLKLHLEHIDELNAKIAALGQQISEQAKQLAQADRLARLDAIPGINRTIAEVILAEFGSDMTHFPTAKHAAAWAGLAPGQNESAGRNRSAKIREGNRYLKSALVQAAHAAGHTRDNYLAAQYRRLSARRGKKRAAVAVAHSILVIVYFMLKRGTTYQDLGGDYFDKRHEQQLQRSLVQRLERLGLKVTLEAANAA